MSHDAIGDAIYQSDAVQSGYEGAGSSIGGLGNFSFEAFGAAIFNEFALAESLVDYANATNAIAGTNVIDKEDVERSLYSSTISNPLADLLGENSIQQEDIIEAQLANAALREEQELSLMFAPTTRTVEPVVGELRTIPATQDQALGDAIAERYRSDPQFRASFDAELARAAENDPRVREAISQGIAERAKRDPEFRAAFERQLAGEKRPSSMILLALGIVGAALLLKMKG